MFTPIHNFFDTLASNIRLLFFPTRIYSFVFHFVVECGVEYVDDECHVGKIVWNFWTNICCHYHFWKFQLSCWFYSSPSTWIFWILSKLHSWNTPKPFASCHQWMLWNSVNLKEIGLRKVHKGQYELILGCCLHDFDYF